MSSQRPMRFYLDPVLCKRAREGGHPFIKKMQDVVEKAAFKVEFHTLPAPFFAPDVHSLGHMVKPDTDRALIFRKVYHYPFWQIEQTSERWEWDVAKMKFEGATISDDAPRFFRYWQKRLFDDGPSRAVRGDYVYVPLQGRLTRRRSFQKCSPVDMLRHCLKHLPDRRIVATLHPKETYTASEKDAVATLAKAHPQLVVEVGNMSQHLQVCDFVVTQNSSAAFNGYFFQKPALLFAGIDFHHIAIKADMDDLAASFSKVKDHAPDFESYVWWFLQDQSINAGKDDAKSRIAARLRRFGWPIE